MEHIIECHDRFSSFHIWSNMYAGLAVLTAVINVKIQIRRWSWVVLFRLSSFFPECIVWQFCSFGVRLGAEGEAFGLGKCR